LELIESLDADLETKRRLKAVLGTLTGLISVSDACRELGLGRSRFYELRDELLQALVAALAPKPAGRRRAIEPVASREELERVRRERDELEQENWRLRVQQDLLLAWPNALSRASGDQALEKRGRPRRSNGSEPAP